MLIVGISGAKLIPHDEKYVRGITRLNLRLPDNSVLL